MQGKPGGALRTALAAAALLALLWALSPSLARAEDAKSQSPDPAVNAPVMLGWAERARIFPGNLAVQAKLDTGANTSSLNAPDYKVFERDGKTWVRFTVLNRAGAHREYELEVVRMSKVKNLRGPISVRPVIHLEVCVGTIRKVAELNLSRRKNFIYKLLLGRRFLSGIITVDPSRKFTTEPDCGV